MGRKKAGKRKQAKAKGKQPIAPGDSVICQRVPYEHAVLKVFALTYIPPQYMYYYFEDLDDNSDSSDEAIDFIVRRK